VRAHLGLDRGASQCPKLSMLRGVGANVVSGIGR